MILVSTVLLNKATGRVAWVPMVIMLLGTSLRSCCRKMKRMEHRRAVFGTRQLSRYPAPFSIAC
eukprot:6463348-Amphidinium_carterae.1